jgi:hypothetical protein
VLGGGITRSFGIEEEPGIRESRVESRVESKCWVGEFGWVREVVRGMVRSKREGYGLRREIKRGRYMV